MRSRPTNYLAIILFLLGLILGTFLVVIANGAQSTGLSNIDHGDTLAAVMDGIRQEDFEITAAFTTDGQKLFEYTNYEDASVEITRTHVRAMRRYDNLIFLHNHPVDQASFSSLDLEKLAAYEAGCGIVVSKRKTYVLLANDEWPSREEIGNFVRERPELTEIVRLRGSDGELEDFPAITSELIELVAARYNLSYYEWSKFAVSSREIALAIFDH